VRVPLTRTLPPVAVVSLAVMPFASPMLRVAPDETVKLPVPEIVFDPQLSVPLVTVIAPLTDETLLWSVTPLALAMLRVSFAPVVNVPAFEIVWALDPFKVIVAALAALKLRVAPETTETFPFRLNVPVMPIFTVPDVTVRLSIESAEAPLPVDVPLPANSRLAYVRPENEGVIPAPVILNRLPV